ncbi:MAG: hypothetical protein QM757_42655 [Paludibaculum sp.]
MKTVLRHSGRRDLPRDLERPPVDARAIRFQISEKDRWAIVAYVRALQRSWRGTMADVPADSQAKVR